MAICHTHLALCYPIYAALTPLCAAPRATPTPRCVLTHMPHPPLCVLPRPVANRLEDSELGEALTLQELKDGLKATVMIGTGAGAGVPHDCPDCPDGVRDQQSQGVWGVQCVGERH